MNVDQHSASGSNLLKRKDRENDDDEQSGEAGVATTAAGPSAWKPKEKKAKKQVLRVNIIEKKVAVWSDINKWNEGDDPLGRVPLEVLDMIINVDSDLDLRDHLALAATCRYFRSCYRDAVFQVLYHSKNPNHRNPSSKTIIDSDGRAVSYSPYSYLFYSYKSALISAFIGPVGRSWNEARWIFSSPALPRDGWAVPNNEWNKNGKLEQDKERLVLIKLLQKEREAITDGSRMTVDKEDADRLEDYKKRKDAWDADDKRKREEHDVAEAKRKEEAEAAGPPFELKPYSSDVSYLYNSGPPAFPTPAGEWGVQKKLEAVLQQSVDIYGKWVTPANHVSPADTNPQLGKSKSSYKPPEVRDVWESEWRSIVAKVVNNPRITKTDAMKIYKVTEKELAALKMVHQPSWKKPGKKEPRYFIKSSVEALSLRSHGGVAGHKERLKKLEARAEKAHATKVKNGTLYVAKPKPPRYSDYYNDYYDDY